MKELVKLEFLLGTQMHTKLRSQLFNILLIAGALTVATGTFVTAFKLGAALSKQPEAGSVVCESPGQSHTVIIQNDIVSPAHTDARACDTITIVNNDHAPRLIAFGQHDRHVAYDGVREREVEQGQTLTITLNQEGSFLFHDHDHEEVRGTFAVGQ